MDRQFSYIFKAVILLALLFAGSFFILKIIATTLPTKESANIDDSRRTELSLPLNKLAAAGKTLFQSNCAACHTLFKDMTGPGLMEFEERGPWVDRKNVYAWIKSPVLFMKNNVYAQNLKKMFGTMMPSFPDITNEEVDAICSYINEAQKEKFISSPIVKE